MTIVTPSASIRSLKIFTTRRLVFVSSSPVGSSARMSCGWLTIARAMVEDAPILILDEATSSVDTRTEELIQKAMDALTVGRTSFVIAHRLSTIRGADQILVINGGEIIERGTHEQLLAADGFYANLLKSQYRSGLVEENDEKTE